jgi:hypothetical protein
MKLASGLDIDTAARHQRWVEEGGGFCHLGRNDKGYDDVALTSWEISLLVGIFLATLQQG